ncbi:flagellar brake protein [Endothiovibrio diazotrophicus]
MSIDYQSKGEQLTDPQRINALLGRIRQTRVLLTVIVPGGSGRYNSLLVAAEPDKGYLLLDELTPLDGHKQAVRQRKMRVYASLQGVQIDFHTDILEVVDEGGAIGYRVPYPTEITYLQRRSSFRVVLPRVAALPVIIELEDEFQFKGYVVDISAGGIRARFPLDANDVPYLRVGDRIPIGIIELSRESSFKSKLEVRFAAYDEDNHELVLGCRYVDVDRQALSGLERFVMHLQREQRKKMSAA